MDKTWRTIQKAPDYELSRSGLVRRRHDLQQQAGQYLMPHRKGGTKVYYTVLNEDGIQKRYPVSELMEKIWPEIEQEKYSSIVWLDKARSFAKAENTKLQRRKQRPEQRGKRTHARTYTRACHDCGVSTNNYRCETCWGRRIGDGPAEYDASDYGAQMMGSREVW